jgi:hypothetical protein
MNELRFYPDPTARPNGRAFCCAVNLQKKPDLRSLGAGCGPLDLERRFEPAVGSQVSAAGAGAPARKERV